MPDLPADVPEPAPGPPHLDLSLVREVAPGLVAQADPAFIERVIENLLSNVAKHTPPGTVAVLTND